MQMRGGEPFLSIRSNRPRKDSSVRSNMKEGVSSIGLVANVEMRQHISFETGVIKQTWLAKFEEKRKPACR